MGKAKKRSFKLGIHDRFSNLSREDAVLEVVEMLHEQNNEAFGLITLSDFLPKNSLKQVQVMKKLWVLTVC